MGPVRYLLDTCTFIWLCSEPARLSRKAQTVLDAADTTMVVSDATALEIVLKWTAGKLILPQPPRQWIGNQLRVWAVEQRALSRADMYRASELPAHHADPFDRLLVATALADSATIVTPDETIHAYPVACIW